MEDVPCRVYGQTWEYSGLKKQGPLPLLFIRCFSWFQPRPRRWGLGADVARGGRGLSPGSATQNVRALGFFEALKVRASGPKGCSGCSSQKTEKDLAAGVCAFSLQVTAVHEPLRQEMARLFCCKPRNLSVLSRSMSRWHCSLFPFSCSLSCDRFASREHGTCHRASISRISRS